MATYLTADDIKSNLVRGFTIAEYLTEGDSEIVDLAERLGVRNTDQISTPLHYKIKRYAVVFVLMRIAQDHIGSNSAEVPDMEKYVVLYNMYARELQALRSQISIEMMTGNVNEVRDRAINTATLYRG